MGKFIQDFKDFAMRGNVIDMAVGVIVGGAFGKIVTSLVNDIIMPVVGILTGGVNFTDLAFELHPAELDTQGNIVAEAVKLQYGMFIQNIVDFLIIALCIFIAIRMLNKLKKKEEEKPAAAPEPSNEEKILTEIRDLLKDKK